MKIEDIKVWYVDDMSNTNDGEGFEGMFGVYNHSGKCVFHEWDFELVKSHCNELNKQIIDSIINSASPDTLKKAKCIIESLDQYGRSIHPVEYGLPIDPDFNTWEDEKSRDMLAIVIKTII